ncbi:hypothetical protein NQ314_002314 [Rhamnusium bicolor]|uniref:Uncharacterized protein n=1 Tax=Rhamnusium bicolor TaxID=1586634 RepID=A0AAV8ZSI1_9CUCU|nr:hypothetical protein NQ314_002314 [Rhamnusium bicolor]
MLDYNYMNLPTVLLLSFVTIVVGKFICSNSDCHECVGNTCNLTCQGEDCSTCPNGDCCNGQNCNVCLASICCSTAKCNQCVNDNRELCNEETASELCDSLIPEKCGIHFDKQVS